MLALKRALLLLAIAAAALRPCAGLVRTAQGCVCATACALTPPLTSRPWCRTTAAAGSDDACGFATAAGTWDYCRAPSYTVSTSATAVRRGDRVTWTVSPSAGFVADPGARAAGDRVVVSLRRERASLPRGWWDWHDTPATGIGADETLAPAWTVPPAGGSISYVMPASLPEGTRYYVRAAYVDAAPRGAVDVAYPPAFSLKVNVSGVTPLSRNPPYTSALGREAALLSTAAYCTAPSLRGWDDTCMVCKESGARPRKVTAVTVDWPATGEPWLQAIVLAEAARIVVAFRGSVGGYPEAPAWSVTGGRKMPTPAVSEEFAAYSGCDDCRMVRGYYEAFVQLAPGIIAAVRDAGGRPDASALPLYITGHSLGGALASIGSYELALAGYPVHTVVTFGALRAGNAAFAQSYNALLLHQRSDAVTLGNWTAPPTGSGDNARLRRLLRANETAAAVAAAAAVAHDMPPLQPSIILQMAAARAVLAHEAGAVGAGAGAAPDVTPAEAGAMVSARRLQRASNLVLPQLQTPASVQRRLQQTRTTLSLPPAAGGVFRVVFNNDYAPHVPVPVRLPEGTSGELFRYQHAGQEVWVHDENRGNGFRRVTSCAVGGATGDREDPLCSSSVPRELHTNADHELYGCYVLSSINVLTDELRRYDFTGAAACNRPLPPLPPPPSPTRSRSATRSRARTPTRTRSQKVRPRRR